MPKVLKESSRFLLVEARATKLGQGIPDRRRVDDEPRTGARYLGHWTRKTERRGQCVEMRVECWSDEAGRRVVGGGATKGPRSSSSNSSSRFAVGRLNNPRTPGSKGEGGARRRREFASWALEWKRKWACSSQ